MMVMDNGAIEVRRARAKRSEPRDRSAPAMPRAGARAGETEGQRLSNPR
jgi:hypothetical protein